MRENRHVFRVIYGDTDAMGIVYYANYLRYFEAGRSELMRAVGFPYKDFEKLGYGLPVASANVRYVAPARYDDELACDTAIAEVRFASVRMTYTLTRLGDQQRIATGETVHACLGPGGTVTRFPPQFREKLRVDGGAPEKKDGS